MSSEKDKSKVHKLSLKGSSKLIAEFFEYSINTILFQRGVYPAEDFTAVKKYGLNMLVTSDDQVKAYIKKIMSQLNKWMVGGKISKLVVVITDKETGDHVERWQFDVQLFNKSTKKSTAQKTTDKENSAPVEDNTPAEKSEKEIQAEIQSIFRQITASVTFLPQLDGNCTFNVLVYADADSDVPIEWGDSDAKEIKNGEKVQLRSFSTSNHRVDTLFISTQNFSFILYNPPARRHYHRQWLNHAMALAQLRKVEGELDMLIGLVEDTAMKALQARRNVSDCGFSDLRQTLASRKLELELVDAVRKRIFGDK
ncbi:MAG: hypothetical protein L6R38_004598 [Xanthoria sp. 2 TBL-2021]|nr:MAG: hypothetical protein L6R38_004598 [Xanthoria sp. 2 TBL-2021]